MDKMKKQGKETRKTALVEVALSLPRNRNILPRSSLFAVKQIRNNLLLTENNGPIRHNSKKMNRECV